MIIRGDFGALAAEAGRLDDIADRIDGRLSRMRLDVDDFLASGWTGSSATKFLAAFDEWHAAAGENAANLHELVAAVRGAADEIAAGEHANAQVSESMTSVLPVPIAQAMGGR